MMAVWNAVLPAQLSAPFAYCTFAVVLFGVYVAFLKK